MPPPPPPSSTIWPPAATEPDPGAGPRRRQAPAGRLPLAPVRGGGDSRVVERQDILIAFIGWIRSLVTTCRTLEVNSLIDFEFGTGGSAAFTGAIAKEILHELRLVYFTPPEAKDAGFLETEHFGVLFPHRMSHIDLTGIPQRWLRDLTWDYLANLLRSPRCPRSAGPVDDLRRAAVELGAFLEVEAPVNRS
ncbi:hypothetical protein ACIG5E_31410 [Kitasatospora sp. NPDC053057]|uniref:hypothetical protein n=1 Tax=Kitasatospora sp. NPDC053057 TaxID=3364062 RepID=UPI0037C8FFFB